MTWDQFYDRISELLRRREPAVLLTVVRGSGSVPAPAGAKMVVTATEQFGTIGGGRLEHAACCKARELIGKEASLQMIRYDLVQDLSMTCGGSATVLIEPLLAPPRLVIFGGGHIAQPLCAAAVLAGFEVTVCEERAEWITPERFPAAKHRIHAPPERSVEEAHIDAQSFVTSVSAGHAIDLRIVIQLLQRQELPRYIGVIGSRRKGIVLRRELIAQGAPPAATERVRTPMGLNIAADTPGEIAISIVAELIAELRGVNEAQPW